MTANAYAMDKSFMQSIINTDEGMQTIISTEVLKATRISCVPKEKYSFVQLLDPDSVQVGIYISHYQGHLFKENMKGFFNFTEGVYMKIGKGSPNKVAFWICIFYLDQHNTTEEVGDTPEEGYSNVKLASVQHSNEMVLSSVAQPMQQIWCVYGQLGKAFLKNDKPLFCLI